MLAAAGSIPGSLPLASPALASPALASPALASLSQNAPPPQHAPRGILMLVHRIPFPPDRGDKIRSFHVLKALSAIAPVHLAAFADDARDMGFADALIPYTASQCIVERRPSLAKAGLQSCIKHTPLSVELFDNSHIRSFVRSKIASGTVDRVFAFSGQMAQFVPSGFDGHFVMDFVDVDSAKFDAYAANLPLWHPMHWVHAREGKLLAQFEARIARRADHSLFVSTAEADLFRQRSGAQHDQVCAVGNGVDLKYFHPDAVVPPLNPRPSAPLLVFTGQMDYRPNIDAVAHFARAVFPLIRAQHPAATFAIVGRAPTAEVQYLAQTAGVVVTGAVDDVRSWLAVADVVVAPLLLARGIQNKVLEAMAMALPVVASPAAAHGIDAVPGRDVMVADGAVAMADAVIALINDRSMAVRIGTAARAQVEARYSWDAQLAGLPALMAAA